VDVDLSGAVFREANLSGVRMRGVLLFGADIDGAIDGLVVNGVEVGPLISDELDRRHPERTKLRPTDASGLREAWQVVESFWASTMSRALAMSEADRNRSVDAEWSFAQTLRHLVFVTDGWLGRAVLGEDPAFDPLGLPPSFVTDGESFGIDTQAQPDFAAVVAVREGRQAKVREFLASVTDDDLSRPLVSGPNAGWPPPVERNALECLLVILDEEWAHHRFAVRDLDALAATDPAEGS
jgi:hypothetical protein